MATPADQRLLDLLDKWLKSLELHLKYSSLDDDSYLRVQPWPKHQRPGRWIVDLARQKALGLRVQVEERVNAGDTKFSDSLELMGFLANLVGAEHIERFIPLADADTERAGSLAPPDGQAPGPANPAATGTREMPKFVAAKERTREPSGTAAVARTERRAAGSETPAKRAESNAPPGKGAESNAAPGKGAPPKNAAADAAGTRSTEALYEQVIADAVRLVQWGRKWYELAELISSMADRPSLIDVRRILKDNKTVIDKKAGRS